MFSCLSGQYVFILGQAYLCPDIACTIFIFEARQAGIPALSKFISRQNTKAIKNIHGFSKFPAVRLVSPVKYALVELQKRKSFNAKVRI